LELGIAGLLLFSGVNSLREQSTVTGVDSPIDDRFLAIAGLVTGVGSALTGTGGPLLLIPILLFRRVHLLTAIGLAQVVQIPISFTATLGNVLSGSVDFRLGLILGVVLAIGSFVGAKSVHFVPVAPLKKAVASLMLAVGVFILLRSVM